MGEFGWSKAELARRSGVAYDSINKYLRGVVDNPRGDILDQLSRAVGKDTRWLLFGESDQKTFLNGSSRMDTCLVSEDQFQFSNTMPDISSLPHLGWHKLQQFVDADLTSLALITRISEFQSPPVGRDAVLSVPDNSMAPDFRAGDLIICSFGADPRPNDLVIASVRKRGNTECIFRRYELHANHDQSTQIFVLDPINKSFPVIKSGKRSEPKILGRIIGHAAVEVRPLG